MLIGCGAKVPHQEVAYITKPLKVKTNTIALKYAMSDNQLKLYQPYIETFLHQKGIKIKKEGTEVIIAPVYIGSLLIYNNPREKVQPLPAIPYKEIESETGYTLPLSKTFYQSLGYDPISSDYSTVSEGLKKFGIQTISKTIFTYGANALLESEGYQIITDVYVGGERTRIFTHTFAEDDAKSALPILLNSTAKQIASLIKTGDS